MKTLTQFMTESSSDMLGLHGKKVPVKTDQFDGHAHIEFDSIKRGHGKTHSYKVDYKGKALHDGSDYHQTSYMSVEHDNGHPTKFKDHPHSSKDLSTLLHKAAPKWVKISDLKPKPSK